MPSVGIIGAGLAGSEAALVLARAGVPVVLYEMRPGVMTPAHKTALPAELVCSNSLKSIAPPSAHGVLKEELRMLGSPLLETALRCSVPAGSALAVDRRLFSEQVQQQLERSANVTVVRAECREPPPEHELCIVAAGPLASEALTGWLTATFSSDALSFYDAIAPVVAADSLDYSVVFTASRHQTEGGDYLNCPFSEQQYRRFHEALVQADEIAAHEFENARFFEACLPVEVIARRGYQSLAFGPLRPIGLVDPATGRRPFAVCQLRRETRSGESYSLVGFQTRLRMGEQRRVFRMIPGLENAEFLRYGSIHRNTYLCSPRLLRPDLSFRERPDVFLAGQLCGSEGYTENIVTGHACALSVLARLAGDELVPPPDTTAVGALLHHVCAAEMTPFTPSNVNFGLFAPLDHGGKRVPKRRKKELVRERALRDMAQWIARGRTTAD